ncbi:asparagine synthetase B family protein [Micromonospora endophytica]|uniref:asparagine synthetase B family protein n=1 Tax=Micromonospora endophytica TaxID=515350 RepID=UPI0020176877|nr:hypothetical protein [Micromonospora endophytica]
MSFDADLTRQGHALDAMTQTMACRGPDGHGTFVRTHAALGHRRLAIIDLPGGGQPMTVSTPAGDVALVYSGEVYNFQELRERLTALGHTFRTSSDTEVVLHGYLQWAESVVDHIEGMYAFAIWDERDQKLVLVRDRMGIKPLFYYPTPDGVLFGSEPKAILANPLAPRWSTPMGCGSCLPRPRHLAGRCGTACTRCCLERWSPSTAAGSSSACTGACARSSTPTATTTPWPASVTCSPM